MSEPQSLFHHVPADEQISAVRNFEDAREAMRVAMRRHDEAWRACRRAGLEPRFDSFGRARWPEGQGDWRPVAGEPIRV